MLDPKKFGAKIFKPEIFFDPNYLDSFYRERAHF